MIENLEIIPNFKTSCGKTISPIVSCIFLNTILRKCFSERSEYENLTFTVQAYEAGRLSFLNSGRTMSFDAGRTKLNSS